MALKAIIFDFDGVLADTMQLHLESEQATFEKHGLSISRGKLCKFFGMKVSEFNKAVIKEFGLKASVEETVREKYNALDELIKERGVKAVPGARELAFKAKKQGLKLGIASGSRKKFVFAVLERIGLKKLFDVVLGEEDVENGKPSPEIFLKCAEKLKVKPAECLVIEDAENGIIAAKKAGMKALALKSSFSGEQDYSRADKIIKSFKEVDLNKVKEWFG